MTSEQEMAEMERMSSEWRPDAPVMTTGFTATLLLVLIRFLGTFSRATAVNGRTGH